MASIVLIRHGETAWNAARRLQGHTDIELNEAGRRQAARLARALSGERFDAIVSSDLLRAHQTAQALAGAHGLEVLRDARLRERCYGGFEGLTYTEIASRYPDDWEAWQARHVDAQLPPGERPGESFRQFYRRSMEAIFDWAGRHPDGAIAIVAHGGVLECAYRNAHAMALESPRTFPIHNASINRFRCDGAKLALDSWGEVDHLAGALDELP